MQIYEIKVSYHKNHEGALMKKTTELYLVEGESVLEAETLLTKYLKPYAWNEELSVERVVKLKTSGGVLCVQGRYGTQDYFYKVKGGILELNDKTGLIRVKPIPLVISAEDIHQALKAVEEFFTEINEDYKVLAIQETAIVEYLQTPATA